jgi:multidrug efflux pump subunit AcrB
MILAVVVMFNSFRQAAVIWLTAPLALVGVTIGLLLFQAPFEFMAILGFLSLIGMMVKNAIVLVDQIDQERSAGVMLQEAILASCRSRLMPVALGALTTILGVAPLLLDPFFKSMTVVIMFGLAFATILTLAVVPLLYNLFFRGKNSPVIPAESPI